jgi:hypothetical protein
MEKLEEFSFFAVRTDEDANLEMQVKNKIEKELLGTPASAFIPLRQTKIRINGATFSHLEMAMPNYVFILNSGIDDKLGKKIKKIKGVEEILSTPVNGKDIPTPIEWKEMSKFIKSTPTAEDIINLYASNTYVIFGANAGAKCSVVGITDAGAQIVLGLTNPITTTIPVWYIGKEETQ